MADYVTNTQISVPLHVPGLKADADLGGLKFSYQHGIFFEVGGTQLPITLPPPMPTTFGGAR